MTQTKTTEDKHARYRKTPKAKARMDRYCKSAKGLATRAAVQRRYYDKVKLAAFEAYGGAKCACCGETRVPFLTLDHVDDDGAEHRRALNNGATYRGAQLYQKLKTMGWPKTPRIQVLCYNCNCGKRSNGGVCPHEEERAKMVDCLPLAEELARAQARGEFQEEEQDDS